jgi:alcohol dehydrogenase (NADP+)
MRSTAAWTARESGAALELTRIERRDLRPDDVAVRIDFCGVCHTDHHQIHGGGPFPLVPGHEFVGTVLEVGAEVTAFGPGDAVAVGNIVDSCGVCDRCRAGQQNFCIEWPTLTYGGRDRVTGDVTLGGYSGEYVVREDFVYPLPDGLDPAGAAPLMCAGITVWEPLRALQVGSGTQVAVAGLGGLGHLAVKLAAALGAEVTVLTRTAEKAADAERLGASGVLVTTDADQVAAARDRFAVIIDTIPAAHDLHDLLSMTAMDGSLAVVGYLGPIELPMMDLLVGRKRLTSGGSGGVPATRELLEFAAEHGVVADVEVLPWTDAQTAVERVARNDARYRLVLDLRGITV